MTRQMSPGNRVSHKKVGKKVTLVFTASLHGKLRATRNVSVVRITLHLLGLSPPGAARVVSIASVT